MPTEPEIWKAEKLARRKALRQAVVAVRRLPQANRGSNGLIRRRDVLGVISKMEPKALSGVQSIRKRGPSARRANI